MTTFGGTFDASSTPPSDFPPVPVGAYLVKAIESDLRPTKDGTGKYLRFVLEILEGQYAGRRIFDNINIENPSQTAVDIGRRRLSQMCHAVAVLQVRDSDQLHGKPMIADVAIEPPKGEFAERNKVLRYHPRDGASPTPTGVSSPQNGANAAPPWTQRASAQA
jgi:hypothetical protein